jgi:glycosyltransferase involved in cell wall biosynthesis
MVLLLKHLDRVQFELTLCLLAKEGPFLPDVPQDVPVVGLGKHVPSDVARVVWRLARLLRRQRPDVVLAKIDYANEVACLATLVARVDVPLVLCEESVQSRAILHMSHRRFRHGPLRWAYRRATRLVAPSLGVVEDLRDVIGVERSGFDMIPNAIETEEIEALSALRVSHAFSESELPLIVTAGRLEAAKGQDDLLAAFEILSETHPSNLLIIGDGAERSRLEGLARRLGVAEHVAFPGFVANPFGLMAQADVFVSASHFESFGNVIVEAMAVGVPVVSTRVPCGPEAIVSEGETGIFANAHDPADLADKIKRLLDDRELRRALVSRAKDVVRQYDVSRIARRYEEVLLEAARRD